MVTEGGEKRRSGDLSDDSQEDVGIKQCVCVQCTQLLICCARAVQRLHKANAVIHPVGAVQEDCTWFRVQQNIARSQTKASILSLRGSSAAQEEEELRSVWIWMRMWVRVIVDRPACPWMDVALQPGQREGGREEGRKGGREGTRSSPNCSRADHEMWKTTRQ